MKGHGPPRNFENWVVCAGMHLVRFEGSMIRKQAAKSELKNVAITQTVKLRNRLVGGRDYFMYVFYSLRECRYFKRTKIIIKLKIYC